MCGIAGILSFEDHVSPEEAELAAMVGAIRHRGPDEQKWAVCGRAGLGISRLAIIDPAGSHQPLWNESHNLAAIFNGEIYNYKELRDELARLGHEFTTRGDGEVIVHGYEEWGTGVFERLRGMFAIALWDDARQSLLLARDRMGIKPLYVYRDARRLLFASEVKAILAARGVAARMREEALDLYLAFRYVPGPATLFEGVDKVSPGEYHIYHGASSSAHTYHRHSFTPKEQIGEEAAAARLRVLLERSIELHLQSDVPLGVFLSGGIDSSLLAALATRQSPGRIDTFTVGFDRGGKYDETAAADFTARTFGTRHHALHMSASDFAALLPAAVRAMDEPMADPSSTAMLALSRLASEHVRVVLSGEGADELFCGYPRYQGEAMAARVRVPRALAMAARVLPLSRSLRRGIEGLSVHHTDARHLYWATIISDPLRARLLAGRSVQGETPLGAVGRAAAEFAGGDNLDRLVALDLRNWLVEDLLLKKDKMGMSASIEARVPYLDQDVVSFALRLPAALKVRGTHGKRVFRRVLAEYLPEEVLSRPKVGFAVPLADWFRSELRPAVEALARPDAFTAEYVSRDAVREMIGRHTSGRDLSLEIFTLLVLELWGRIYINAEDADELSARARRAVA